MTFKKEKFLSEVQSFINEQYDCEINEATPYQLHAAISRYVMREIDNDQKASKLAHLKTRRACYFSAEFLVGRAIYNNLFCLGILDEVKTALNEVGSDINSLEDIEDAALGNGGLGRLAACFLDSAATLNMPMDGFGIRYKFGLFKQDIVDGAQVESADDWTRCGDPWSRRQESERVEIHFSDQTVYAVPYDMPIIGYKTNHISNLRLWQAESVEVFNFKLFNEQKYDEAVKDKNRAEDISRTLYPNDDTDEGKTLRLRQQYFFTAASITDILRNHKKTFGSLEGLAQHTAIQLNDTHPVISIPELIRQLVDLEGMNFNEAVSIAKKIFSYTNHTVMAEALEKWDMKLIKKLLPRICEIIYLLDKDFSVELKQKGYSQEKVAKLPIIQRIPEKSKTVPVLQTEAKVSEKHIVHMAHMAIAFSSHVNGVARIHTEILKKTVLPQWYELYPEKFTNKTNGITQRRWLGLCNSELTSLISDTLKNDDFLLHLSELKKMKPYVNDEAVMNKFIEIKHEKKHQLAEFVKFNDGIIIDEHSIFDTQIKRLHEYKRQMMNAFSILYIYFGIKDGSIKNFYPTTFIFAAKSAPGYKRAKGIIKLINEVSKLVSNDKETCDLLKVVFVKNYNVTAAEKLVAGADVSEQISTAGTEASGTGNMKLTLNGTVTLGTYDGANIEIVEEAGKENNYIFGATVEELETIMKDYKPRKIFRENEKIRRVIKTLVDGTLNDGGTGQFKELYTSLLIGASYHRSDNYYLLGDLESYVQAKLQLNSDYSAHRYEFYQKCFLNMCSAGKFSSDRTIKDYANEVWNIEPVSI